MTHRLLVPFIVALHGLAGHVLAAAMSQEEVLSTLRARDNSVSSYDLVIKRAFIRSAVDVEKAIREVPATQPAGQPQELVSRLAERFADGKEIRWMTYHTIQQGRPAKTAKTVMNLLKGYERVIFRDSERVLCFQPQPGRVQVDIFSLSNAFPEGVFDFDQLGL
ncbi:MAG TPA: hypothetical protein VHP11_11495, partial [Tepidisphaeraceae bacterium]|nr:hypothetical protein [Tepidisphaeraceae bacterium]